MAQRNLIDTRGVGYPFTIVDAIFEHHITGVIEIHLRESQCDGVIQIAEGKVIAFAHGLIRNAHPVEHCIAGDGCLTHKDTRELKGRHLLFVIIDILRKERGKAVAMTEEDTVIVGMKTYAIEELLLREATDTHETEEGMSLVAILPDAF